MGKTYKEDKFGKYAKQREERNARKKNKKHKENHTQFPDSDEGTNNWKNVVDTSVDGY